MQLVLVPFCVINGMPSIGSSLSTGDNVVFLCQHIHQFTFAFITPLCSQYNTNLGIESFHRLGLAYDCGTRHGLVIGTFERLCLSSTRCTPRQRFMSLYFPFTVNSMDHRTVLNPHRVSNWRAACFPHRQRRRPNCTRRHPLSAAMHRSKIYTMK